MFGSYFHGGTHVYLNILVKSKLINSEYRVMMLEIWKIVLQIQETNTSASSDRAEIYRNGFRWVKVFHLRWFSLLFGRTIINPYAQFKMWTLSLEGLVLWGIYHYASLCQVLCKWHVMAAMQKIVRKWSTITNKILMQ